MTTWSHGPEHTWETHDEAEGLIVRTARGVEFPLFAKGWGPEPLYETLADIESLLELEPGSRRV